MGGMTRKRHATNCAARMGWCAFSVDAPSVGLELLSGRLSAWSGSRT